VKRKLLLIPLALLLAISLVVIGCPTPSAETTTPTQPTTPAKTTTTTTSSQEGPIKLIWTNWCPMEMPSPLNWDPFDFMGNRWCDTIEEETGGKVVFDRYPGASLIPMPDVWDGIKAGVCDVGLVHPATEPGQFPLSDALALPGLFPNSSVAGLVLSQLWEEGWLADEWSGVKVLFFSPSANSDLVNRVRPVETLEDWKDLQVGVEGEPETSAIRALGAIPVSIPVTEQYIALERGTIDATYVCMLGQVAFKFYEVAPYITAAQGGIRFICHCMNQETYDSLPADVQEVIDRNSGKLWSFLTSKRYDATDERTYKFLDEYQAEHNRPTVVYPSDEEMARWREIWAPVHEQVISDLEAKGLPARAMIERARELSDKYTSWELGGPWVD
jgi:TRAP-type C4-dicarboxylate transport system substrate-binding protein